jgi:hypothetical protein
LVNGFMCGLALFGFINQLFLNTESRLGDYWSGFRTPRL